jgi:hypothetical protein
LAAAMVFSRGPRSRHTAAHDRLGRWQASGAGPGVAPDRVCCPLLQLRAFSTGRLENDIHHSDHAAQNDGDATRTTGDLSLLLSKYEVQPRVNRCE